MKLFRVLLIPAMVIFLSGCASILMRNECSNGVAPPYIGTITDAQIITGTGDWRFYGCALAPYGLLDLPFSIAFDTLLLPFDLLARYQATHPDERRVIARELPKQIKEIVIHRDTLYVGLETVITKWDFTGKVLFTGSNKCWRCADLGNPEAHQYRIWVSDTPPAQSLTSQAIPFSFPAEGSQVTATLPDKRVLTLSDPDVTDFIDHKKPHFAGLRFTVTLVDGTSTNKTRWIAGAREWDERLPKKK